MVYNRTSGQQTTTLDPSISSSTTVARQVDENGWIMSLSVDDGVHADHFNTFGSLETAEDALEWHDNPEIRSPCPGVSLFFNMETDSMELTYDIRALDQELKVLE